MDILTIARYATGYPAILEQRVQKPADTLYYIGAALQTFLDRPRIAVVGSRNITSYGRLITEKIITQLVGQGFVIISGLALGVDTVAHQTTIDCGGSTIAVLPTSLNAIAPHSNQGLARRILSQGGALLSTYSPDTVPNRLHFVERNQYVAALSDAVLVTEAAIGSGSLRTVDFALDMGVPVFAVPGNITSPTSAGTNNYIKSSKIALVTSAQDILSELGINTQLTLSAPRSNDKAQQQLLNLLFKGIDDGQQLLEHSGQSIMVYNQALTMLEINGQVRALGGNHWALT